MVAMQPPVIAHQAASSGLTRFSSSQICRCGFTQTPVHLYLHLEKLQLVSWGQLTHSFNAQGKSLRTFGVTLSQPSQQIISSTLKGVETTENASMDAVLKESGEASSIQVDLNKQPLPQPEAFPATQEVPSTVEGLYEPSASATIDSKAGEGASLTDFIPPQPDIKSLDQSSNLETLRSNAEASINAAAASDSPQDAANTATEFLSSDQFKSTKEAYEAMLSGTRDSMEPDSSVDALSQASQSIADGISEVKTALVNAFMKVQESIQSSVDGAIMAVKSTYENINGSIVNSIKGASGSDENSTTVLEPMANKTVMSQGSLFNTLTSPFQMGTPVNNALKGVVTTVEDITGKALGGAGQLVANGYTSTKEFLPVDVRLYLDGTEKKVAEVSGPIQSVFQQIYTIILDAEKAVGIDPENPIIPVIVVIGGSISLGVLYWQLRYGGYSGDVEPASALDLLGKEGNIVLVDIRPEDLRESEGIPDLRRQARFKVASVEAFKVQGSLQRILKNAADAEASITAAVIKNLKNVQCNTKVIVMDADGSQSKSIARALKKAGIKMPYRIGGGFRAWEADGLRVKQMGPETPLTIIKEETQAILDAVKPTPGGIAAATLGVFAGVYALIEWEKTLQLLGLVCIGQVLYTRLNSYNSVDDAKDDLKVLLRPFALATGGIVWVAGQLEPSKLQLATSPSTSAVQDRVLQAAAKHGPLPSEFDQEEQESQPSEASVSKGSYDGTETRE